MTNNIYFISDHHLNHANVLTFKRDDDTPLRDFPHVDAMHEYMIEKHNSVVRPQDKVYFLGDVAMDRRGLPVLHRMNGHKRLVRGNHDIFKTREYLEYFDEINGVRVFGGLPDRMKIVATHVPIHPDSLESRWTLNVHGHYHSNHVKDKHGKADMRYKNVCVDYKSIDYTPVSMDELIAHAERLK